MFAQLEEINSRPEPFEFYTASDLWTDEYTAKKMLAFHLESNNDYSSRKHAFINRSVDWIVSEFNLKEGRSVIDFGCGPGLYTERLAKTKADVTGIDFSKSSIDYARGRAKDQHLPINYLNQNYLEFKSDERYDLIIMIYCDYCALSPAQRQILLGRFKAVLKPDGSILLDVSSENAFHKKAEGASYGVNELNQFWSPDKYYGFLNTFKYQDAKVTLDQYMIIEQNRTRKIYNWLQYFSPESIAREFAENGLQIEKYLANVAGDGYSPEGDEFAIVARLAK